MRADDSNISLSRTLQKMKSEYLHLLAHGERWHGPQTMENRALMATEKDTCSSLLGYRQVKLPTKMLPQLGPVLGGSHVLRQMEEMGQIWNLPTKSL